MSQAGRCTATRRWRATLYGRRVMGAAPISRSRLCQVPVVQSPHDFSLVKCKKVTDKEFACAAGTHSILGTGADEMCAHADPSFFLCAAVRIYALVDPAGSGSGRPCPEGALMEENEPVPRPIPPAIVGFDSSSKKKSSGTYALRWAKIPQDPTGMPASWGSPTAFANA